LNMTTRIALALLVSTLSVGCAAGHLNDNGRAIGHGAIVTHAPSVQSIVRGPVQLRVYAGSSGGRIFVAENCGTVSPSPLRLPVKADQSLSIDVPTGYAACLATDTRRSFELLWRARGVAAALALVVR
jgi:hypothetical protein